MTGAEYTLEEISYSRKEHRRIMESVLTSWLVDPKALNFFSPESKYPFKFKKWVRLHYSKDILNICRTLNFWKDGSLRKTWC